MRFDLFPRLLHGVAVAIVCTLLAGLSTSGHAAELVIGQVAPLDDPDNDAGRQMNLGVQLCFDMVNARGGIHGARLRLVAKNRGRDPAEAVVRTRELIAQSAPLALVGLIGTGPMEALVKDNVLSEFGIPAVGIRTGAGTLHDRSHPFLFHTRASYAMEIDQIIRILTTVGVTRIALFYENSAFGKEGLEQVTRSLEKAKLALVAKATYEVRGSDAKPAVKALLPANPLGVILVANSVATADFYKEWRRADGNKTQLVALSTADPAQVWKRVGKEAHGLGLAQVVPNPTSRTLPIVREMQEQLKKQALAQTELNHAMVEGYIAAKVVVEALRRAGPAPTRGGVRAALESIKEFDVGGLMIAFSPNKHSGSQYVDLAILNRDGALLQ